MSDLPKKGICDRCNATLKKPSGYLVWNPMSELTSNQPVGAMMICNTCAKIIFMRARAWTMTKELLTRWMYAQNLLFNTLYGKGVDMSDPEEFGKFTSLLDGVHMSGIIQRLRKRGLDKEEAMKWARELGELWWSKPKKAEKKVSKEKFFSSWK